MHEIHLILFNPSPSLSGRPPAPAARVKNTPRVPTVLPSSTIIGESQIGKVFVRGGRIPFMALVWFRASFLSVLSAHAGRALAWTPSDLTTLAAGSTVCRDACSTHGSCRENKCFCFAGWLGETCNERDCSPCIHGKCLDGECRCDEGYTGSACRWAACANNCSGHGACVEERCLCADGWTGPGCEEQAPWSVASCPNDCSGHGACFSGRCQCDAPWSGEATR